MSAGRVVKQKCCPRRVKVLDRMRASRDYQCLYPGPSGEPCHNSTPGVADVDVESVPNLLWGERPPSGERVGENLLGQCAVRLAEDGYVALPYRARKAPNNRQATLQFGLEDRYVGGKGKVRVDVNP